MSVLSNATTVKNLRDGFVNAWVLGKDLAQRARSATLAGDEDLAELFTMLEENYSYPVDSIVISPALELLGQRSVSEVFESGGGGYGKFLADALEKAD